MAPSRQYLLWCQNASCGVTRPSSYFLTWLGSVQSVQLKEQYFFNEKPCDAANCKQFFSSKNYPSLLQKSETQTFYLHYEKINHGKDIDDAVRMMRPLHTSSPKVFFRTVFKGKQFDSCVKKVRTEFHFSSKIHFQRNAFQSKGSNKFIRLNYGKKYEKMAWNWNCQHSYISCEIFYFLPQIEPNYAHIHNWEHGERLISENWEIISWNCFSTIQQLNQFD